ncbi:MAG: 3-oxoadipate enol-lactonase [Pseudomonadota bacterium]
MAGESIVLGDITLNHTIDGDADNPWLILSNSLATDLSMWAPQIETLTATHRVLRYDTRGHGASSVPEGPYDFDMLVADVISLMDALDIEKADFMGLSLGGMTALGLALDHGHRINRIICCDARADAPDMYKQMWPHMISRAQQNGMNGIAEQTLTRWFSERFREDETNINVIVSTGDMIRNTPVEGYVSCANALMELDYLPRLGEISVPSLYIVGEFDPAAPAEVMQAMADATPGSQFEMIRGAAHLANLEDPDKFNEIVSGWLAKDQA